MTGSKLREAYVWKCFACIVVAQFIAYFVTGWLIADASLHDLSCCLDSRIPFRPEWVVVYFFAYGFWVGACLRILCVSPEHGYRVTCAYLIAMAVSAAIFIVWPGTIDRPEPTGDGFFMGWVRLLYRLDEPKNLCPSLHVMNSYFCWRGTWGCRGIPSRSVWTAFFILILVCLSILYIKQHAIVDIPAAVIIAEGALQAARAFPRQWISGR